MKNILKKQTVLRVQRVLCVLICCIKFGPRALLIPYVFYFCYFWILSSPPPPNWHYALNVLLSSTTIYVSNSRCLPIHCFAVYCYQTCLTLIVNKLIRIIFSCNCNENVQPIYNCFTPGNSEIFAKVKNSFFRESNWFHF